MDGSDELVHEVEDDGNQVDHRYDAVKSMQAKAAACVAQGEAADRVIADLDYSRAFSSR